MTLNVYSVPDRKNITSVPDAIWAAIQPEYSLEIQINLTEAIRTIEAAENEFIVSERKETAITFTMLILCMPSSR